LREFETKRYPTGLQRDHGFDVGLDAPPDGPNLEQLVEWHGPLAAERAIHVLRQVCHSLAEAHAHGLVHRDVKAANIVDCLVKDPAKRPSSAEQVSARLSAIQLDTPWSAERARQWWAEHAT
jgi:hypothetical protein